MADLPTADELTDPNATNAQMKQLLARLAENAAGIDLATVKTKTLADATNFDSIVEDGRYKVASNLSAGTMLNCPSIRAGILEVLSVSTAITIQRYTPYNIENKVYFRTSNGRVWPASWQELLVKSEADLIYTTKTTLSDSISSAMGSVTQSDYYGKKYTTSEVNGSTVYTNGVYVGYNSIYDKDVVFNVIESRIFNSTTGNIEYRIWIGSKVSSGATGYFVNTKATISSPDFSGVCRSFPKSDTAQAQTVVLDKAIAIPKNTPFVIVFKAADLNKFGIAHATSVSGNLENRGFNLVTASNEWSALTVIGNGGVALGYVQAGFKLLVSIPQSSGGGITPDAYTPVLVFPPRIYAMSGLETHIYPEHLLVEDYELYKHDVTCNRGQQRNRGFVWSPSVSDPTGNYVLSWSLHDKQKGTQLTSASTTIQLAALNAKSGQTVKALVIGDSLVNAGSITQRLLDIAVDDVMKVQLIGTRGTGLNKHEGRGGWKIEDYAGAGRSNYKFTVSGVVTPPAINSTTYTYSGRTFLMQEVSISGGSGYVVASLTGGSAPTLGASGILTKANSGVGDATIAFSDIEALPTNPFWNTSTSQLDFANYLSYNSLATPDYVFIQLGVNDVFAFTSDQSVIDFTTTAFSQLDALISSIKAAAPSVKIAVAASPVGANQDAFGTSYGCGQTAWRYRRNLVMYNKQLYVHYAGKEGKNIYVLGSGVNVDTESNFPTSSGATNSQNSTVITSHNNGVHPADSGYRQLADAWFPFMKVV